MAMNAKTENSDGFEHQNWKTMMALNAKTENSDDGSKRQTENSDDSERWYWEMITALNAKLKIVMALNAETGNAALNVKLRKWWWWLWTPKLKSDGGSERQDWKCRWLWTLTEKW